MLPRGESVANLHVRGPTGPANHKTLGARQLIGTQFNPATATPVRPQAGFRKTPVPEFLLARPEPRSLLQKCQLPRQGALCTSIRRENALLRPLEARFLSFRGLPTANSVDLASHRTFETDS